MKKNFIPIVLTLLVIGCKPSSPAEQNENLSTQNHLNTNKMAIQNEAIKAYTFLEGMLSDPYFPNPQVEKGQQILKDLCIQIETEKPADLNALYVLTHEATERFNDLDTEFGENGSEIETSAREEIASEFEFIANTYGFDADIEELIATREW